MAATRSYHGWDSKHLIRMDDSGLPPEPAAILAHDSFRAAVLSQGFACVAGASAIRANSYRFGLYSRMSESDSVRELAGDLRRFIEEFPLTSDALATYVATFQEPVGVGPLEFEKLLWATLQELHDIDDQPWDPSVSSDPDDQNFSFSFAGRSFFVIGLHSGSERWSRRMAWPTLVFNAHEQFEELRRQDKYAPLQRTIRRREVRLQGSVNQSLTDHGQDSEAKQYSGRAVEPDWQCPFHARESDT